MLREVAHNMEPETLFFAVFYTPLAVLLLVGCGVGCYLLVDFAKYIVTGK